MDTLDFSKLKTITAASLKSLVVAGAVLVVNQGIPVVEMRKVQAAPNDPPSVSYPANLLDLSNWKITLPVETPHEGKPDEIKQPELATYASPFFTLNAEKDGVEFSANVGGATTSGSGYPRSELREMKGDQLASWSNKTGVHTMEIKQSIDHTPTKKPHVVAGQIHDSEDDVVMIRLEGNHLFVEGDGDEIGILDNNYQLGTTFTTKIVASGGYIKVFHNGIQRVSYKKSKSGLYFKAGCYTQSNVSKGDLPTDYGQVTIYDLKVTHE